MCATAVVSAAEQRLETVPCFFALLQCRLLLLLLQGVLLASGPRGGVETARDFFFFLRAGGGSPMLLLLYAVTRACSIGSRFGAGVLAAYRFTDFYGCT